MQIAGVSSRLSQNHFNAPVLGREARRWG